MIHRKNRSSSTLRAPLMALAALPLLALAGCQDMKNAMQGGLDKANATANSEADRQAAFASGEDPSATHRSDPSTNSAQANSNANAGSNGAVAGSGATAGGGSSSTSGARASNTSANDDVAMNDGAMDDGDDGAYSDDASYSNGGGDAMPSEPTVTNRKEDVEIGTEHWGWTDAKVGWYVRFRYQGGMETSQEVVEATDDLLLMETRTIMPGMEMPASRAWQARRFVKYDGEASTECKSDTRDLGSEAMTIGGKKIECKVTESTTTCPGMAESHSKSWMSDDVPGESVKVMSDGQVVMELIEFRK